MPRNLWRLLVLTLVLALVGVRPAAAQDSSPEGAGEIDISCTWFGVGGVVRAGEWAGLRLAIRDSSDRQREVLIRLPVRDPDGDRALYEGTLTTNPGVSQPYWVYLRIPADFSPRDFITVQAFEAVEQDGAANTPADQPLQSGYTAGRLLGSAKIQPRGWLPPTEGMIGVVGAQMLGLTKYGGVPGNNSAPLPTGHERTEIVTRLDPDSLPDRWMGLAQFSALVWHQPEPGRLADDRAEALREWVQRGGHLIIVLPRVGQTWTDPVNNPLYDLTPRVRIERREGANLEPFRTLITTRTEQALAMPTNEVLQVLHPAPDAGPYDAIPILAGPAGEGGKRDVVAVRRLYGTGMVTMLGIDIASRWMQDRGLPDPQLLWHRILGRRGVLWSPQEFQRAASDRDLYLFRESPTTLDQGVLSQINMTALAATGVFLGFVVFVAYWVVAGPVGFALLKRTGLVRHAWVGFAAAAGLFTALAWGGATLIRPADLDAKHITIFDHVYGQNAQRARSFVSLYVPQYGVATLAVGEPLQRATNPFRDAIAPFDVPGGDSGSFPDARGYPIDSRRPSEVTFPSRSTVKQFQVDWAGGAWTMPRPVDGSGGPGEIRLEGTRENPVALRGLLVHDLPAALREVTIVTVLGQKDISRSDAATNTPPFLADARAVVLPNPWAPGETLDLSLVVDVTRPRGRDDQMRLAEQYLRDLTRSRIGRADSAEVLDLNPATFANRMKALTFFQQLEPPDISGTVRTQAQPLIQRRHTHNMDLSAFFTQPCVIIVGVMDGPCPVPLQVSTGGAFRPVKVGGTTIVRWVYPLQADPPSYITTGSESSGPESEPEAEGEGGGGWM